LVQELITITIPNTTSSSAPEDSPRFGVFRADIGDRSAVQKLVQDTLNTFGRIDVVVSNAGWTRITDFRNLEEGMVDEVSRLAAVVFETQQLCFQLSIEYNS
jgi:NAD(P)-dependent dehydrogenase (short-subunit alcohol dehydrogenase family)